MTGPTEEEERALGIIGAAIVLASVAFVLIWNWLAPSIFGLGQIGILEALGIMVLVNLMAPGAWAKVHAAATKAAKEMSKG